MKMKLQATGYSPTLIEYKTMLHSTQMLEGDKRGVCIEAFELMSGDAWVGMVTYLTTWGTEREFSHEFKSRRLDDLAADIRKHSDTILPPGAGFPATPAFETRQIKLIGMIQTLTLVALSDVLNQAYAEGEAT